MSCKRSDSYKGADFVCKKDVDFYDGVYINALNGMGECDRKNSMSSLEGLSSFSSPPKCYVYCAQRTCGAAESFMKKNSQALSEGCSSVYYVKGGALEMREEDLVDGKVCHSKIIDHNMKGGVKRGCLTCEEGEGVSIPLTVDGEEVEATYFETKEGVPDWYERNGIDGSLPPHFFNDERYVSPLEHGEGKNRIRMNVRRTGIKKDAKLAYWASNPSDKVEVAENAYGNFENRGIVFCKGYDCDFDLNVPSRYTSEGKVFKKHIHVTDWNGKKWNEKAKTIDIE